MFALGRVNYPHNCHTLDLTKDTEVEEKGLQRIWFEFENLTKASNASIEVRLQGFNWAGTAEGLYSSTEAIRFTPKQHRKYAVQVIQRVFVEADTARNCGNYPHGGFASYKACDDEFQRKSLESLAPGLVPVWLADHLDQVTTHMVKPQTLKGKLWTFSMHLLSRIIHKLNTLRPHIQTRALIRVLTSDIDTETVLTLTGALTPPSLSTHSASARGWCVSLWSGG